MEMEIAILLYDGLTALDAIGPYEVLNQLPDAEIRFVAAQKGVVKSDGALSLVADFELGELSAPQIVVVPGGFGTFAAMQNQQILAWLQTASQTALFTTSVCTGSLILAAAGLLNGLKATCHWHYLENLQFFGAQPTAERIVEQNKIITAAGVSSGVDMALRLVQILAGDATAQAVQLAIEYDPAPPFNTGSPKSAPPELVKSVAAAMNARATVFTAKS